MPPRRPVRPHAPGGFRLVFQPNSGYGINHLRREKEREGKMQRTSLVSSEADSDYLEFYIDDVRQDRISGDVSWAEKSYEITGSGSHTLKWRYVKDASGDGGDDRGFVDYVRWTEPETLPTDFEQITYTYDPSGRRIAKALGFTICYLRFTIGSAWLAGF